MKCAGDHDTLECPGENEVQPKCANCGDNHFANDKNCPELKRYLGARQTQPNKNYNINNQPNRFQLNLNKTNFPILKPTKPIPADNEVKVKTAPEAVTTIPQNQYSDIIELANEVRLLKSVILRI